MPKIRMGVNDISSEPDVKRANLHERRTINGTCYMD